MNEIITIIGSSYFNPNSTLLEGLKDCSKGEIGSSHIGEKQNGYAASTCLLSVVCLESYVMRSRYINSASGRDLERMPVNAYIQNLYGDYQYFDKTTELFVVRDVLAHNHLLSMPFDRNKNGEITINGSVRASTGDKKFSNSVDLETERTKIMGLNTNPVKIGYGDASLVLKLVWDNLLFLEKKDRNQCYVSHLSVKHKGERMLFGDLVKAL